MKKLVLTTIAAVLVLAATAQAKAPAPSYLPKPDATCRAHYRRETVKVVERHHGKLIRRHHHVVMIRQTRCVYIAPRKTAPAAPVKATSTPTVQYQASVDPTLTQAPGNPLAVSYDYSASATSVSGGVVTDLATTGQLPSSVLNFFSSQTDGGPEQLYCSMNVGGATSGGTCPIAYDGIGQVQVTTQYVPNTASAVTETDSEGLDGVHIAGRAACPLVLGSGKHRHPQISEFATFAPTERYSTRCGGITASRHEAMGARDQRGQMRSRAPGAVARAAGAYDPRLVCVHAPSRGCSRFFVFRAVDPAQAHEGPDSTACWWRDTKLLAYFPDEPGRDVAVPRTVDGAPAGPRHLA